MNTFVLDKEFGKKYEEHFAKMFNLKVNNLNKDDDGIDIYGAMYNDELNIYTDNIYIDVKAYRKPIYVKSFKGVYIETYSGKCRNLGWYYKDNNTTHYLFVIDCDNDKVEYKTAYLISKENLYVACDEAYDNNDVIEKSISTSEGFVLPYKYLEKYGVEIGG